MRVVVQRVINSSVEVDGKIVGKSDRGLMLLVGFTEGDSSKEIDWMVDKVINLRIFEDENDVMNKSLLDINGNILMNKFNLQPSKKIGELLNKAFEEASKTNLKGILDYTEDPIVSVDIIGNTHSCLFDAQLTSVIDKMVKVVGWYDNEIGYSSRLIDLILLIRKK